MPKLLYIRLIRENAGWPTVREDYGHGDPIVVVGVATTVAPATIVAVTTHRGKWESHLQGEGGQVSTIPERGGTRDA